MKATKRITRLCSILLAVVIVMAMSVSSAFAGTITINNATEGATYTAYKLFDLQKSEDGTAYSYYTTNTGIATVLKDIGLTFDEVTEGNTTTYYVKTVADNENIDPDNEYLFKTADGTMTAAELAQELNKVSERLGTAAASGTVAENETSVTLTNEDNDNNLPAGYYFVTSSMGSLCLLDTNDSAVTIKEKNATPTVNKDGENEDKSVTEGTAEVGDVIDYTITVVARPGADSYVLHDQMSAGLTLNNNVNNPITVAIRTGSGEEVPDTPLAADNYTVTYKTPDPNSENDPNCAFEITFTQAYLDTITTDTTIVISYSATVNENAVVGKDPVTNQAILDYGNGHSIKTDEGKTETYTYDFDLTKVNDKNTQLQGAEFKLYDSENSTNPIMFIKTPGTEGQNDTYRVAMTNEQAPQGSELTDTITVGKATIEGLAGKSYWLEETVAPAGYNKLGDRVEVKFTTTNEEGESLTLANSDLEDQTIENKTGSELPSTGGMGTTVIYIVGGVLVAGAAVLLVTRRRMHA